MSNDKDKELERQDRLAQIRDNPRRDKEIERLTGFRHTGAFDTPVTLSEADMQRRADAFATQDGLKTSGSSRVGTFLKSLLNLAFPVMGASVDMKTQWDKSANTKATVISAEMEKRRGDDDGVEYNSIKDSDTAREDRQKGTKKRRAQRATQFGGLVGAVIGTVLGGITFIGASYGVNFGGNVGTIDIGAVTNVGNSALSGLSGAEFGVSAFFFVMAVGLVGRVLGSMVGQNYAENRLTELGGREDNADLQIPTLKAAALSGSIGLTAGKTFGERASSNAENTAVVPGTNNSSSALKTGAEDRLAGAKVQIHAFQEKFAQSMKATGNSTGTHQDSANTGKPATTPENRQ